jgi:hypothetical protein
MSASSKSQKLIFNAEEYETDRPVPSKSYLYSLPLRVVKCQRPKSLCTEKKHISVVTLIGNEEA